MQSGIAAAGGLAMTQVKGRGDSYSNGLIIGFRMVQVAIGESPAQTEEGTRRANARTHRYHRRTVLLLIHCL